MDQLIDQLAKFRLRITSDQLDISKNPENESVAQCYNQEIEKIMTDGISSIEFKAIGSPVELQQIIRQSDDQIFVPDPAIIQFVQQKHLKQKLAKERKQQIELQRQQELKEKSVTLNSKLEQSLSRVKSSPIKKSPKQSPDSRWQNVREKNQAEQEEKQVQIKNKEELIQQRVDQVKQYKQSFFREKMNQFYQKRGEIQKFKQLKSQLDAKRSEIIMQEQQQKNQKVDLKKSEIIERAQERMLKINQQLQEAKEKQQKTIAELEKLQLEQSEKRKAFQQIPTQERKTNKAGVVKKQTQQERDAMMKQELKQKYLEQQQKQEQKFKDIQQEKESKQRAQSVQKLLRQAEVHKRKEEQISIQDFEKKIQFYEKEEKFKQFYDCRNEQVTRIKQAVQDVKQTEIDE